MVIKDIWVKHLPYSIVILLEKKIEEWMMHLYRRQVVTFHTITIKPLLVKKLQTLRREAG